MSPLPPLTWSSFASSWQLEPGWLAACLLLAAAYAVLRGRAGTVSSASSTSTTWTKQTRSTVRPWRAASYLAGCALLWVCVASGIGRYSMSVFWMHMVLHLLLIMVVPVLIVLGHPVTVVLEALPARRQARARAILRGRALGLLTHALAGLTVYTVVIIGTHLTAFMDQMTLHPWLMTLEQAGYVVAGVWLFLPLLGEEPTRSNTPYLARLVLLLLAMVPDTLVGIVLLQTTHDPFPVMMAQHPDWAPPAMTDIHAAGGLMWAGGDGLMMCAAIGLMISVITSPTRREHMTGTWLESVRGNVIASESGLDPALRLDPDSDAAYAAYNRMLQERAARHDTGRSDHEESS